MITRETMEKFDEAVDVLGAAARTPHQKTALGFLVAMLADLHSQLVDEGKFKRRFLKVARSLTQKGGTS